MTRSYLVRTSIVSTFVLLLVANGLSAQTAPQAPAGGSGQQAPRQLRDAREMAPDGLIGSWAQNMAKSKYEGTPALKERYRTFDYTDDGKVLCNWTQINQAGRRSVGHWAVVLDGTDAPEYIRGTGSIVSALVGIKKVDEHKLAITVREHGVLTMDGMWTLADDGKTLTQFLRSLDPTGKVKNTVTAVFEKQE